MEPDCSGVFIDYPYPCLTVFKTITIVLLGLPWIICLLIGILVCCQYCCLSFCYLEKQETDICNRCEKCHCKNCGRLKCEDNIRRCDCSSCSKDEKYKDCHLKDRGACIECSTYETKSESCLSKCWFNTKKESCKCCTCQTCFFAPVLKIGNLLTRMLYGGKLGLVREFPRANSSDDEYGRETMYVNEFPIPRNSNVLHCMITLRVLVFFAFCFSAGGDALLVHLVITCKAGADCHFHIFEDDPGLENCRIKTVPDSNNDTKVCYLGLDLSNSLSTMGGLITFSTLETAIVAYTTIWLYKRCCYYKGDLATCRKTFRCVTVVAFQIIFAIATVSIAIVISIYFGEWERFFGYYCSVACSILIPWYLVLDENFYPCKCTNLKSTNGRQLDNPYQPVENQDELSNNGGTANTSELNEGASLLQMESQTRDYGNKNRNEEANLKSIN